MMRTFLTNALALILITGLTSAGAADPDKGKKLYRWVDAEGNTHYTDKLPPEQVQQGRDELNTTGVRVKSVPQARTREEIEREKEEERLRAEQKRIIEEQKAKDDILLNTFNSEDDIIMMREGKVTAIDAMIESVRGNIRRLQSRLAEQQRQAASTERSGRATTAQQQDAIKATNRSIEEAYATILHHDSEKKRVRELSDRDLKRYREIKHITVVDKPVVEETKRPDAGNIIECKDPATCDKAWAGAEKFVKTRATTPMQMQGDNIVMSAAAAADKDVSITLSRIKDKQSGQQVLFLDLHCKQSPVGKEFCSGPEVMAIRQAFRAEFGGKD